VRSILLQQPGVLDAGANWQAGVGWVIYDPGQAKAEDLAQALSAYYPAQVTDDRLFVENQQAESP
jgi:hypothetical protein